MFVGVLCLVLVLFFSIFRPSRVEIILMGKRELVSFLTVVLMPCDSLCSVFFPHGAVGWTVVCNVVFPDLLLF